MIKDSIAILCRGESLKEIKLLPDVEEYIIINGFSDEFDMDFIDDVLRDKKITHVLSLGALSYPHPSGSPNGCFGAMVEKDQYKKYNIEKIVLPYVQECLPHDANNPYIHQVENRSGNFVPVYALNDENKKFMMKDHPRYKFTYPSCGMASIACATIDLGKKNIYVVGMDFYEDSGYLSGNVSMEDIIRRCSAEGQQLKKFLPGFIEKNENTNFYFYTYSDFNSNIKNLEIINLKKR